MLSKNVNSVQLFAQPVNQLLNVLNANKFQFLKMVNANVLLDFIKMEIHVHLALLIVNSAIVKDVNIANIIIT